MKQNIRSDALKIIGDSDDNTTRIDTNSTHKLAHILEIKETNSGSLSPRGSRKRSKEAVEIKIQKYLQMILPRRHQMIVPESIRNYNEKKMRIANCKTTKRRYFKINAISSPRRSNGDHSNANRQSQYYDPK